MVYRRVNKRTKILPLATFHIAHLCNQFNRVCSANFYSTFQKPLFLIKIALKLTRPHLPPAAGGSSPYPQNSPPMQICGYALVLSNVVFVCHCTVCFNNNWISVLFLVTSISSLFFQHAQKEALNDICKSWTMRNHSLCILCMKRRSSAHQVSFTHTPTSYFSSKANGDKKSASKNKPKKNIKTRHKHKNKT